MKRTLRLGESQNQAAWPVFIIWIVFDNMTTRDRLSNLPHQNLTHNGLINRMLRKLELVFSKLLTYALDTYSHGSYFSVLGWAGYGPSLIPERL